MKILTTLITSLLLAGAAAPAFAQPPRIATEPLPRQPSYDPVNCEKAPKGAVTRLTGPAAPYALVFCSPTGHTVAPPDGYVWFPADQPGQLFLFAAATKTEGDVARSWFSRQSSRKLSGAPLKRINDEMVNGYKLNRTFDNVVELDTTAADGQAFNIFFFIDKQRPMYVLGCVDACKTSVLLREYSLQEAREITAK